jgi:hypothetical protein
MHLVCGATAGGQSRIFNENLILAGGYVGTHIYNMLGDANSPTSCYIIGNGSSPTVQLTDLAQIQFIGVGFAGGGGSTLRVEQHAVADIKSSAWGDCSFQGS